MQVEQAPMAETHVGSDYQWATLNVASIIGGHTFPAGTRIVVAPSQTSMSVIGKAHTSTMVTKVWAKFGQTFDSSSWIPGTINPSLYTLTGQAATWSSSVGFGDHGLGADVAVDPTQPKPSGPGFFTGLALGVLAGGVLATLLYVGLKDEEERKRLVSKRYETISRRRQAGYAYEKT